MCVSGVLRRARRRIWVLVVGRRRGVLLVEGSAFLLFCGSAFPLSPPVRGVHFGIFVVGTWVALFFLFFWVSSYSFQSPLLNCLRSGVYIGIVVVWRLYFFFRVCKLFTSLPPTLLTTSYPSSLTHSNAPIPFISMLLSSRSRNANANAHLSHLLIFT